MRKRQYCFSFYRADSITENYKSLVLRFKGDFSIEFRAYNDGIAYRFINHSKQPFCIKNETVEYHFLIIIKSQFLMLGKMKEI